MCLVAFDFTSPAGNARARVQDTTTVIFGRCRGGSGGSDIVIRSSRRTDIAVIVVVDDAIIDVGYM